MKTDSEKAQINRFLGSAGLGQLSDPGLIQQIGFLAGKKIRNHDDLKVWINTCDPAERGNMLEALRPYLKFTPKPLDVYVAEIGMQAEIDQLPVITDEGKLRAFNVPELTEGGRMRHSPAVDSAPETSGDVMRIMGPAEELSAGLEVTRMVMEDHYNPTTGKTDLELANELAAEVTAKKHLRLLCGVCTREEVFHGWDKQDCVNKCRYAGWRYDFTLNREICKACAK